MFGRTIANSVSVKGIGVFCGQIINVKLQPAEFGTGIRIIRDDIKANNIFQVDYQAQYETKHLNTTIYNGFDEVRMIEHLISALWCFKITDIEIHTDQNELPMLDGSAMDWVKTISSVGTKDFDKEVEIKYITKEIKYEELDKYIIAKPCDRLVITYTADFAEKTLGRTTFTFDENINSYVRDIAPARTFSTEKQIENHIKIKKAFTNDDIIIFGDEKVFTPQNRGLRFPNEATRHKILDLIGDLTSSGNYICGEFICHKTGHYDNRNLLKMIYD